MAKPTTPEQNTGSAAAASLLKPEPQGALPVSQLPLPHVRDATTNNTLPPMKSTGGTAVIITAAVATGVQIKVFWAIKDHDNAPVFTDVAVGTGVAGVEVPVPASVVGLCIGKTLTIWYEAANESSLRLELTVEVIDPENMPIARFLDLSLVEGAWWLDMAKFSGNARVELPVWPFIAAGQRLWVEVVGNEHLPPMRFHWVLEDHVVTVEEARGEFFRLDILREWLAGNEDWSSVTIHAGITYDGAQGTAPEYPDISHIPKNAHPIKRVTANLRLGEAELKLLAPTIREATYVEGQGYLINPANALKGLHVVVAYDGMRPGDQVCLKFLGAPGAGSPSLPCIVVQDGQASVEFHLPPSAVSHNFGTQVEASYSVQRVAASWPSPSFQAQVLKPHGLSGLDVEEKTGGTLCLNNFDGPGTLRVDRWDFIARGQTCWAWVVGEFEDGSPFHWDILIGEPVKPEWVTDGVSAVLAREKLEQLADCQVFDIHFAVNFLGSEDLAGAEAFRPLQLQMVQKDLVLVAPTVLEAVGTSLTAWNGRDGATVRVKYDGITPRHAITLCWKEAGVCLVLPSQPGNTTPGYVDFLIPREAVIHGFGKTVPISFSVESRCKKATSPDLALNISVPVRLPTPVVVQATPPATQDGILDLATFTGDADITVYHEEHTSAWWFALAGQRVWLRGSGTLKDGSPHTINVYVGKVVTAAEVNAGLAGILKRSELELLKDGSSLTITCKVTTDGSADEMSATLFPILNLTIRRVLVSESDDFESYPPIERTRNPIVTKLATLEMGLPLVSNIGLHLARGAGEHVPGMVEGQSFAIYCYGGSGSQLAILRLRSECKRVRFGFSNAGTSSVTFIYYDKLGQELGRRVASEATWMDFQAPEGRTVSYIEIKSTAHGSIDSLTIWHHP